MHSEADEEPQFMQLNTNVHLCKHLKKISNKIDKVVFGLLYIKGNCHTYCHRQLHVVDQKGILL